MTLILQIALGVALGLLLVPMFFRVVAVIVLVLVIANVVMLIRSWWLGYRGLDQWPEPHGRYSREWLAIPADAGAGDYYDWLEPRLRRDGASDEAADPRSSRQAA